MARSLNMVQLIGNVTQDPEIRQIPSGASVCTITVATNRAWKDTQGQLQEESEFHNVVLWRGLADIAGQYVRKGTKVYIRGYLKTRSWEAQDGTKKYKTEIVGEDLLLLSPKKESSNSEFRVQNSELNSNSTSPPSPASSSPPPSPSSEGGPIPIEEIPF
jgi:single-strand DNA-binding protein